MANVTPTPYRTSDLKTKISSLAQTSVYQLKMQPPSRVSSLLRESDRGLDYNRFGENIELLCESAVLPGSGTATHDVTNDYAGVSEKMVYRRMYDGSIDLCVRHGRGWNCHLPHRRCCLGDFNYVCLWNVHLAKCIVCTVLWTKYVLLLEFVLPSYRNEKNSGKER